MAEMTVAHLVGSKVDSMAGSKVGWKDVTMAVNWVAMMVAWWAA